MNIDTLYEPIQEPGLAKDLEYVQFTKPDDFKITFMRWARKKIMHGTRWHVYCCMIWLTLYCRMFRLYIDIENEENYR